MTIRTILAAIALEGADDPVFLRARQLAQHHGARLVVLHVLEGESICDDLLPAPDNGTPLADALGAEAARQIAQIAQDAAATATDIAAPPLIDTQVLIRTGKPAALIAQTAQDVGAGLIVIGPGKPKTIRERMFGSTADRVVRIAHVPVLVVKGRPRPFQHIPYERVSIAMDFSGAAQAAARAALALAPAARHQLVHVAEIPLVFEQAMLKAGTRQAEIDRYRTAKAAQAREQLHRIAATLPAPRQPRLRVLSGDASQMMVRLARGGHADLLAIGRHGGSPASKLLTGSVARAILHAATCDVLICGEDAAD